MTDIASTTFDVFYLLGIGEQSARHGMPQVARSYGTEHRFERRGEWLRFAVTFAGKLPASECRARVASKMRAMQTCDGDGNPVFEGAADRLAVRVICYTDGAGRYVDPDDTEQMTEADG